MRLKNWNNFIKAYSWEILVGLAILFFIIMFLFYRQISTWLKGKQYFSLNKPLWKRKSPPILKKNETRCRDIFETIFQKPFSSIRPSFLKRSNGYALELDGYNKDLKLAFEYNGVQHYKFSPKFHKSVKDFEQQVQRDKDKKIMCQKAGVTLIEIPYTIKYDDLIHYIREELRNRGLT